MIFDSEAQQRSQKWHYLAVKSLPALLRGISSNYNRDFYCLNCSYSYNTKKKRLKNMKEYAIIMIISMYKYLTKTTKHKNTTTEKNY